MRGINKNLPDVKALQDVDFTLRKGEIHALTGENGARRSTLIKALTGVEELEISAVRMGGSYNTIINRPSQEAQENSISAVYQEANLCPNLSVAENLYTGREPKRGLMISWRTMKEGAGKLLEGLSIHIDVIMVMENYSIIIQQMIATIRIVDIPAKMLILGEPTSSLDDGEMKRLFVLMKQPKAKGIGIIFMIHFLEQAYAVCDRITILRNSIPVGESEVGGLPRVQLVAKMMGKDFNGLAATKKEGTSMVEEDVIINARELGRKGTAKPFSLDIHRGGAIGLAGLLDSGRFELVRAIYGTDKSDSGELAIKGKKLKVNVPINVIMEGMAYLLKNRKEEGTTTDLSARENIIIALRAKKGMFKLMSRKEQEEFTDRYIDILQVKAADREIPIKQLSSGNQQKVILGRWLLTNPDPLILDELTRGINIDTKTEIQKLVLRFVERGMAVAFISSEIEKVFRTCSRMAVMHDGEEVGELEEDELSQGSVMRTIAEGGEE